MSINMGVPYPATERRTTTIPMPLAAASTRRVRATRRVTPSNIIMDEANPAHSPTTTISERLWVQRASSTGAFSSEVDTGSREENASKQKDGARS